MPADYRTVRLMKNRLYPTYQLHAVMAARKTTPEDGLKIGVLTILDWLRHRLGPDAPETLTAPQPEQYADFSWENLRSLYINQGYVIDIVSLPEQGAWTMQIVEPDLGSDPGNPEQRRQAVPGRVIESNIAFTVSNGELHCGFRTMISDPEDTEELCEVYRPAFIRLLADNPRFGLRQIAPLTPSVTRVETMEQLRQLASLQKNPASHMPLILFTQTLEEREITPLDIAPRDALPDLRIGISPFPVKLPDLPKRMTLSEPKQPVDPAFDLASFAKSGLAYYRTFLLTDEIRRRLPSVTDKTLEAGETLYWESESLGGSSERFPYPLGTSSREKLLAALMERGKNHARGRDITLSPCLFVVQAKAREQAAAQNALRLSEAAEERFRHRLEQDAAAYKSRISALEDDKIRLTEQLDRAKQYRLRLENEKDELMRRVVEADEKLRHKTIQDREEVAYLRRCMDRPSEHAKIADWVQRQFAGRVVLVPKAAAMLEEKSAREISLPLICDALDFLATDYWSSRFERLPWNAVLDNCSRKYGRPFEVSSIGDMTIQFTPAQYKIKYFTNAQGKKRETALDQHLKVGNDPENLLRIYFVLDEENRLVVVGSLPRHLKAVSIR